MKTKIFSICLVMAMIFAFVGCTDVNQAVIDEAKAIVDSKVGYINISGIACEVSKQYAGFDAYFMEEWVPGNAWGTSGSNKAKVDADGKAKYVFPSKLKVEADALKVQLRIEVDSSNLWDAPFNQVNGVKDITVSNPKDGKTYTLLWKDDAMTFVED